MFGKYLKICFFCTLVSRWCPTRVANCSNLIITSSIQDAWSIRSRVLVHPLLASQKYSCPRRSAMNLKALRSKTVRLSSRMITTPHYRILRCVRFVTTNNWWLSQTKLCSNECPWTARMYRRPWSKTNSPMSCKNWVPTSTEKRWWGSRCTLQSRRNLAGPQLSASSLRISSSSWESKPSRKWWWILTSIRTASRAVRRAMGRSQRRSS